MPAAAWTGVAATCGQSAEQPGPAVCGQHASVDLVSSQSSVDLVSSQSSVDLVSSQSFCIHLVPFLWDHIGFLLL